jgi:hypothetical protein
MSALPLIATEQWTFREVRFVPNGDIRHVVGIVRYQATVSCIPLLM